MVVPRSRKGDDDRLSLSLRKRPRIQRAERFAGSLQLCDFVAHFAPRPTQEGRDLLDRVWQNECHSKQEPWPFRPPSFGWPAACASVHSAEREKISRKIVPGQRS
jgi:hypothetical protein